MAPEFSLLGDVEVRSGGHAVDVGPARQRSVLAVLLAEANHVVPANQLVGWVWGEGRLPANPAAALQTYVSLLRRALAAAPGVAISRQPPGYKADVDPATIDLHRFRRLLSQAQGAGHDDRTATLLAEALSLWRGEPFAGLDTPWINTVRAALVAEQRHARLDLADIRLRQGLHGALLAVMPGWVADDPLDERLAAQYLIALYRSGRQAQALDHFERIRHQLADQLGADPSPPLQDLHQRILRADPALLRDEHGSGPVTAVPAPAGHPPAAGGHPPVPQELPLDVAAFTGRARELAMLDGMLGAAGNTGNTGQPPTAMMIAVVSGTAGAGKTALAVRWGYRARAAFPDGQLYVNLRAHGPAQPLAPAHALAGFLRSFGVADQDIPADLDERARRFRSLLAGRRVLVILDNAGSAEHARHLLPASPSCAVVVTSRDSLAGLVARDGARRLDLGPLPPADAAELLRALIGPRADSEPDAIAAVAAQCCYLPLALRVAAELSASRPAAHIAELARELTGFRERLDLLDSGGDPATAVRTVLSWSCRQLPGQAIEVFARLGSHPGPDFDVFAVAALAGAGAPQASRLLGILARAHLVHRTSDDRYGMHDLLRAYACDLADRDSEPARAMALTRLFDYYLAAASAAMDKLVPAERYRRPPAPVPATPVPPLAGLEAAHAWLDTHRTTLVAVTALAAAQDWPSHATRLADTLFRYLYTGSHLVDALAIHTSALRAARATGDSTAEASALTSLGIAEERMGNHLSAVSNHEQALSVCRQTGHRPGEARALANLAIVCKRLTRYEAATGYQRQALALYRELGDRLGEARVLTNLGTVEEQMGDLEPAAAHQRQALDLFRQVGDLKGEAHALYNLGSVEGLCGSHEAAAGHHRQALELYRELNDRSGEAYALGGLGAASRGMGHYAQAVGFHGQALTLLRELGVRPGELEALNNLGESLLAAGRTTEARAQYAAALDLASRMGEHYESARARAGLASAT